MEETKITTAVLVGMAENAASVPMHQSSLDELERLLETAGGVAFAKVQNLSCKNIQSLILLRDAKKIHHAEEHQEHFIIEGGDEKLFRHPHSVDQYQRSHNGGKAGIDLEDEGGGNHRDQDKQRN